MLDVVQLKMLFIAGALRKAIVFEAPLTKEFHMEVETTSGERMLTTVQRSERPKTYKSADTVINELREIGFKELTIRLN